MKSLHPCSSKPCDFFSFQYHKGELRLYDVTFDNAGMYQCIAENAYGSIYANAELKILGQYPF